MRIADALNSHLNINVKLAGLSPKTVESYEVSAKHITDFFGADTNIAAITLDDVAAYFEHLKLWQSPDTARGNLIAFRSVLNYARRRGWTNIDTELIKTPKREKRAVRWLEADEVEELIAEVSRPRRGYSEMNRLRNIAIVRMLWASGIRVAELTALNRSDIHDRQFTVVGKSKNPRVCFIGPATEMAIADYLQRRSDESPALFVSQGTGERVSNGTVREIFRTICRNTSFEAVHPHTLRHSFATNMLSHDVDIRYIGAMLGHESLDTTKAYTHLIDNNLRRIYDKVAQNY